MLALLPVWRAGAATVAAAPPCPNILFAIADDWSLATQLLTGSMQGTCNNNTATRDRIGAWEVGYNHYHNRAGPSLPNTQKLILEQIRPKASMADCNMVPICWAHCSFQSFNSWR